MVAARPMHILDPRPDLRVEPRSSGLTLWRPEIVLAPTAEPAPDPRPVLPGEPGLRPAAVQAQIEASRSMLDTLAGARQALDARALHAAAWAAGAPSERARVAAVIESYRVKSELDEVLADTFQRMRALIQERDPR